MKLLLVLLTIFVSSPSYANTKIECLRKIQDKVRELETKNISPVDSIVFKSIPSIKPTELTVSQNNEVAWIDGKGKLNVSSTNGNVVINGRNCTSEGKINFDVPLDLAYNYLSKYESSQSEEVKKFCISTGVEGTAARMMKAGKQYLDYKFPPKSSK